MKKIHIVVTASLLVITLISFKKNMFAWIDAQFVHVGAEIRGGGLKINFRNQPPFDSWRVNAGWFAWSPSLTGGYDNYYVGWPEYPTGSEYAQWRLLGFQLVTDRRGGPAGSLESADLLIPMWTPIVLYLFPIVWSRLRRRRLLKEGRCLHCKYPVSGTVCPECGTTSHQPNLNPASC